MSYRHDVIPFFSDHILVSNCSDSAYISLFLIVRNIIARIVDHILTTSKQHVYNV